MVKTAKEIVEYFSTKDLDEPIHIEWFEREEAEMHLDKEVSKAEFVRIFEFADDDGFLNDVANAIDDNAKE